MSYMIYDAKSGRSKAKVPASVFDEISGQRRFSAVVVDGETRYVLEDEGFVYGNPKAISIIVHKGDFVVWWP